MQPGLQDLVAGLREAEDHYRLANAEAFAGLEPAIVGMIEILPLTPKMFLDLDGAGNAFCGPKGTPITPADVAIFLWRCSPYYTTKDPDAAAIRSFFIGNCYVLPYNAAVDEIFEYIRRAWAGMPVTTSKNRARSLAQWPAALVHLFGKNYGWLEEYTLNLPFRRLWQYANRILEDHDPDFREICAEAMNARKNWLIRVNEELKAAVAQANRGPEGRN